MLIPFGILGASGAGAPGAYELISTAYGTGSSSTITFSSIPQTYKHLQIRWTAKLTAAGGQNIGLRLNGITTSSYLGHYMYGNGSSVSSGSLGINDNWVTQSTVEGSGTANLHAFAILDVLDYTNTSKNKTMRLLNGGYNSQIWIQSGLFLNTSAITSISLLGFAYNFTSTSRFSLYGIKG